MGGTASIHPVQSISSTRSSTPAFVPLEQPDINLVVSILEDSSSNPFIPSPTTSSPLAAAVVSIKDKAADLGLKDITDKES